MNDKKRLSKSEALQKLQRYCAYQDRCHQEVRSKLLDLGVFGIDLEEVMANLITEGFLNEERFACSYARGKFRIKRWGRIRIVKELKRRNISDYCIRQAMLEIDEAEYLQALEEVLVKKRRLMKPKDLFKKNQDLARYAIGRGFESPLVWAFIKKIWPV